MFVNITWKRSRKDSVRSHPRSQNATYRALSQRHRENRKQTSPPQQRTEHDSLCHRAKSQRTQPFLQRTQPWILHTNQLARRRPLSYHVACWRRTVSNDCARSGSNGAELVCPPPAIKMKKLHLFTRLNITNITVQS